MNIHQLNIFIILSLLFLLAPQPVEAHAPNQSYIYLQIYNDVIKGRLEMTSTDLSQALNLNLNKKITKADLNSHWDKIHAYVKEKIIFQSKLGEHKIVFTEPEYMDVGGYGTFIAINFILENTEEIPEVLEATANILFDKKPSHQVLLLIEYNWKAGVFENEAIPSLIFSPDKQTQSLSLSESSVIRGFIAMIEMGIWHIWIGIDHILFLLALILPSVLALFQNKEKQSLPDLAFKAPLSGYFWQPVLRFRPALMYIIKIVTFFTIAHTFTLSLAALQIVVLPSSLVESIIAISIALAAIHNITPIFKGKDWLIAFGFGLFHGFGFASVLSEIGLRGEYLVLSLLGFNLGVEIGQLVIICLIFPVLYLIRKMKIYQYILVYGSVLLILISFYWFFERAFGIDLQLGKLINDFTGFSLD